MGGIRAGTVLAAGLVAGLYADAAGGEAPRGERVRVVIFHEDGFPSVDAGAPAVDGVRGALRAYEVVAAGERELAAALEQGPARATVLVTPYGSAFPKAAWGAIRGHLEAGGAWVNLGGVPLAVPVVRDGGGWRREVRQTAYHKALGIVHAFPVSAARLARQVAVDPLPWTAALPGSSGGRAIFELYVRFTSSRDVPDEEGAGGPRDAVLTPLVHALSPEGRPLAAPFVRIDRLRGPYAGGRWVLATGDGALSPAAAAALVAIAAEGATAFAVRPGLARYRPGERPAIDLELRRPGAEPAAFQAEAQVEVVDGAGRVRAALGVALRGSRARAASEPVPLAAAASWPPGLYEVRARLPLRAVGGEAYSVAHATGFWIAEDGLPAGGPRLAADGELLLRDGEPFPVTGTNHMASDVQRRFLLEPNPLVWDRDMAAMKKDSVNLVRTGLWWGWKGLRLDAGVAHEPALRALDAFLLTARRHGLPVIFTAFAFLPEAWGGENPFLDPRSVAAQRDFLGLLARRYRGASDLIWDLINEPSFSSPRHAWYTRPNYDRHEAAAWQRWLRQAYPGATDAERAARLQEAWRTTPEDGLQLPALEEFGDRQIFGSRVPLRVLAYRLFAQDAFEGWVRQMREALEAAAGGPQLVTVGQDEGGAVERPSPLFHGGALDVTSTHPWWFNDDLLWDVLLARFPGRPALVEEAGMMFYESPDGTPWRGEDEAARLLARKLALAAGTAGVVQWLWHTNPYLDSDNEAAIGLWRADGTMKPEGEAFLALAAFLNRHRGLLRGRAEEDVVLVFPHSLAYSVRNQATAATRRSVRLLAYHCRTPLRVLSEYRLAGRLGRPRLVVLPAPRVLSEPAWEALLEAVEGGATLLATGIVDDDEFRRPLERLRRFGVAAGRAPVAPAERLAIEGREHLLSYRGDKLQQVDKAVVAASGAEGRGVAALHVLPHGRGRIVWSPLPVELAEEAAPGAALYRHALALAGARPPARVESGAPEQVLVWPTVFATAVLYTVVSETDQELSVAWVHEETGTRLSVTVPAQRAVLLWVDRRDGRVLGQTAL